jgi:hypothetical protein
MPDIPGPEIEAPAGEPGEADELEVEELGAAPGAETDFAVSTVLLLPTVDVIRGILAAFGGELGEKTAAALVVGVEGAAGAGEETAVPIATGFPMLAMVGVPGTPVPRTGDVARA